MAIIKISQEDINRSKKVDQGWHKFAIGAVEEKANKNKDGVNFWQELECVESPVDPKNVGRFHRFCISSKGIGFHFAYFAAILNCSVDDLKEMELDMDKFKGVKIWAEIKDSVDEKGNIQKEAVNFAPGDANPPF